MTDSISSPGAGPSVCPFVALAEDRDRRADTPDDGNDRGSMMVGGGGNDFIETFGNPAYALIDNDLVAGDDAVVVCKNIVRNGLDVLDGHRFGSPVRLVVWVVC